MSAYSIREINSGLVSLHLLPEIPLERGFTPYQVTFGYGAVLLVSVGRCTKEQL